MRKDAVSASKSDRADKSERKAFRPIPALIVCAGVLIYFVLLGAGDIPFKRFCSLIVFYADPRYWPGWYAVNLWLAVLWAFGAPIVTKRSADWGRRFSWGCFAGIFGVTFCRAEWFALPRHFVYLAGKIPMSSLYWKVIVPYFYEPLTTFMTDGSVSWRLFIVPILVLLFLTGLLRLNAKLKRAKPAAEERASAERSSEESSGEVNQ